MILLVTGLTADSVGCDKSEPAVDDLVDLNALPNRHSSVECVVDVG